MSNQSSPTTNHNPTLTNGRPPLLQRQQHHVEALPYLLARQSPAVYRSIHSANAQRDEAGVHAAKRRLAVDMHDRLKKQAIPHIPLEKLNPESAGKTAAEQFVATTPLATPVEDFDGLIDRLQIIEQLRCGQHSPVLTELTDITHSAAAKHFAELETSLANAVTHAPFAVSEWLNATQRHLQGLNYPQPTKQGLARLANIVRRLRSLQQDPTALPPHKREIIKRRLIHAGHAATIAVLHEIAHERTIAACRDHSHTLSKRLSAWQNQVAACENNLSALVTQLDAEATQFQHRQSRQSKAGLSILEGPSEERVLEVLSKEFSPNGEELVAKVLETWIDTVAQEAAEEFGRVIADQPGQLLARINPAQGMLAFHRVIDQHLSELSLYATLRSVGIERFAEHLFAKAAPLVQMERQSVELGLEFIEAAVLVVPVPHGPEDGRTLAILKNAISAHGSVELRIAPNMRSQLRLTRTFSGFPAAVQSINRALSWAYAKSRDHHHFPHLIGIMRDSPDGRASEAAIHLSQADPLT